MGESITQAMTGSKHDGFVVVTITWQAATDGSLSATAIEGYIEKEIQGMYCILGVTNPGATAPQADYDIELNDADGADVFGLELNNRSATVSEQAMPKMGNGYGKRPIYTPSLNFALTGNNVNTALGTCAFFFVRV